MLSSSLEFRMERRLLLQALGCGVLSAAEKQGMELRLERVTGRLRAALWNRTGAAVTVVVSSRLQPPGLALRRGGEALVPFDERSVQKFDTRVAAGDYRRVDAGGSIVLEQRSFRAEGDEYVLTWGPYQFRGLGPVWTGKIASGELAVSLARSG